MVSLKEHIGSDKFHEAGLTGLTPYFGLVYPIHQVSYFQRPGPHDESKTG